MEPEIPLWVRCADRLVGMFFSLLLLLTIFPVVYVVVAICLKWRNSAPVIVLRQRQRKDGRTFLAYRFRLANEESLLARMPQLINMLRGDVTIHIRTRIDEGMPLPAVAEEEAPIALSSDPYSMEPEPIEVEPETSNALSPDPCGTEAPPEENKTNNE